MNSTIYVQQNIGIPAGPLSSAETATPSQDQAKKPSVGAVIRPMPRETGKQGSVRLDQAKTKSPPLAHIRNNSLDDYVNWLRDKIKRDQKDVRPSPNQAASDSQDSNSGVSIPAVSQVPIPANDKPRTDKPSNEMVVPVVLPTTETNDSSHQRGFSTKTSHRVDQPHDGISEAYLKFDELRTQLNVEHAAKVMAETQMKVANQSDLATDVERKTVVNQSDLIDLIDKISKAIASVLTETSDDIIEQKLGGRHALEASASVDKQVSVTKSQVEIGTDTSSTDMAFATETVASVSGAEIASVEVDKLDRATLAELADVGGNQVADMQLEADKVKSEILSRSPLEIPTNVAAWDVEDFRWPVITNRMIVSGGEALDQLSQKVSEMLSPSNHRLAVTGVGRGEGATSIAISLARWAAACGKQVLLVDADLATPGLTQQVGLAPSISWVNAVSQSMPAAEVIVRSQQSNLCIMPLAEMVSKVTWPRFIYDNLGELVDQVRHQFDLVILDVGPANQFMSELSRAQLLSDATLLVHDGVDSREFQKSKNRLKGFGLDRMIIAENRTQHASANVA